MAKDEVGAGGKCGRVGCLAGVGRGRISVGRGGGMGILPRPSPSEAAEHYHGLMKVGPHLADLSAWALPPVAQIYQLVVCRCRELRGATARCPLSFPSASRRRPPLSPSAARSQQSSRPIPMQRAPLSCWSALLPVGRRPCPLRRSLPSRLIVNDQIW